MIKQQPEKLVIATRASRLALWQALHVQELLRGLYPGCDVQLLELTTRGDQILDRTLSKVGGKGLFVKELETALLDGRADLAVHSLKDVPVDLNPEFSLACIMTRADPRDAVVANSVTSLDELDTGAIVGTSSLRRESQIRAKYPHLVVKPLRGNLDTRLAKLDRGDYAAIVLAAAGLQRLGMAHRIGSYLPVETSLPAAGQGALGIEILANRPELQAFLAPLSDPAYTSCAMAERAISRALGGSCQVPLAAYATMQDNQVFLRALVAEPDGSKLIYAQGFDNPAHAEKLGQNLARQLIDQGAAEILTRLLGSSQDERNISHPPKGA